jgi:hypothetical protein
MMRRSRLVWRRDRGGEGIVVRAKLTIAIHVVLTILGVIALAYDIYSFGTALFSYYTIDSNVLQTLVSSGMAYLLLTGQEDEIPSWLSVLHLVCAVALTITFLIAALVLAPQEGFAYYFLENVAPINHFLAPLLSVLSFLFLGTGEGLPKKAALAPVAATMLYGGVLLLLNITRVVDGPYFFLRVYETAPGTIAMWFLIIAALCGLLSGVYCWIRGRNGR